MKYRVAIKRNSDGKTVIRDMGDIDWDDSSLFWWTEGNFGCDCNRYLEFERALGNKPMWDDPECSDGKYSVLYAELESGERIEIDEQEGAS